MRITLFFLSSCRLLEEPYNKRLTRDLFAVCLFTFFFPYQGSYVGNSKVVGQVTAIDKDQDEKNSVYGQIKYEFVNQTSKCIT